MKVNLKVNGRSRTVDVEPRKTLLDTLREDLALVGSHAGCEHGVCGACTILLDGAPVRSCLMFAAQSDGYEITTIEGLAPAPGELGVIQDAFCETHGLQCGYCTPGMILTAHSLLEHTENPTREDIVEAISGNICRCTGYGQIVEAIEFAADRLRKANAPRHLKGSHANEPVKDPNAKTDAPQEGVLEAAEADTPHGARS
jgi:carbon-monoxide dehydrogenase small subunit